MLSCSEVLRRDEVKREDAVSIFDFSRVNLIQPQHGGGNEPIGDRTIDKDLKRFLAIGAENE